MNPLTVPPRYLFALIYGIAPLCSLPATGQDQSASYCIHVTLDDQRHRLSGDIQINYVNRSRDTLTDVMIHLYPNAYASGQTAFAQQQLRNRISDFHFAQDWELGFIDSLEFTVDYQPVPWFLNKTHPDIAQLLLTTPLLPGDSVSIATGFRVKIPRSFSRLGHMGQSYQMTQWFPKIAVYDEGGWHAVPYLDQGEFFSDFGNYDVSITLPSNYVVAATGTLQDPSEERWLDSLASVQNAPMDTFPKSSTSLKTLRFVAQNVHDFAWFADKRFAVRREVMTVGDISVICRAFFTHVNADLWEKATGYIRDAIRFYSERVGDYPYPHMTAVQAPLSKGGGMEYPMITLIRGEGSGFELDQVIAHEVGHNWFYGVLASNERKHPWMDEGVNSFYEYLYLLERYDCRGAKDTKEMSDAQLYMQYLSRCGRLQSSGLGSASFTSENYVLGVYEKPALAFWMLYEYMGPVEFDSAMQEYFQKWKFRHPLPGDIRAVFESHCNCALDWLFDQLLNSSALIDYALTSDSRDAKTLTIRNQGQIIAPVQIIAYDGDSVVFDTWIDGFAGSLEVLAPAILYDRIQLYSNTFTLDESPSDNVLLVKDGKVTGKRMRIRMLGGVPKTTTQYLNITPIAGWNDYDKGMIGAAFSNVHWPPGNLMWVATPMYASGSNSFTGMADIRYKVPDCGGLPEEWEFGLGIKSFHYNRDFHYGFRDRYIKIAPHVQMTFAKRDPFDTRDRQLRFRGIYVGQKYGQGVDFDQLIWERRHRSYWINELSYTSDNDQILAPQSFSATITQGSGFLRLTADFRQKIVFSRGNKGVYLHGFAGWLPHRDSPDANVNFFFNGTTSVGFFARDFLHDEWLLARNARSGVLSHQVFMKDAQLKTLYNGGISDSWMIAAGLATDTPLPLPIQPYVDLAIMPDLFEKGVRVSYSGGLALVIVKDVLEIFFPLVESKDIRESLTYLTRKSVMQRASFMINFKTLHPFRILEKL